VRFGILVHFPQPSRNIALAVQDPPNVDVIISLDVENEKGVTR
jgi:hypothetical protein